MGGARRIGFIGVGRMGRWMALNLAQKGFPLRVWDRDPRAVAFLAGRGAGAAESAAELAGGADWVFLSLPDPAAIEEVVFGDGGVAAGARPGLALVDCGTSAPLWTRDFAARVEARGLRFVDAPVSGMEERARTGTLTIMVGGPEDLVEELRPALEAMGSEVVPMGGVGNGQLAKTVNNILFNANVAALAEVLPMAVKLGLDPEGIARAIDTGSGQSFASHTFLPGILAGRFDGGYPLAAAYKDMQSAAELSARHRIPLPVVHAALATYQMALAAGLGGEDKGAMVKVFERALGVEVRGSRTASDPTRAGPGQHGP